MYVTSIIVTVEGIADNNVSLFTINGDEVAACLLQSVSYVPTPILQQNIFENFLSSDFESDESFENLDFNQRVNWLNFDKAKKGADLPNCNYSSLFQIPYAMPSKADVQRILEASP
jgi:hypothetical protein